jgi:hypothetical protein
VQQGKATSAPPIPLVEMRHCLRNTEKVVDNNMELFEAQRVEDIKVGVTAVYAHSMVNTASTVEGFHVLTS